MKCPACRSPLLVVEHERIELDHCPRCGGTWFDRDELALLFDAPAAGLTAAAVAALPQVAADEKRRRCPACGRVMRKTNIARHARVLVDACPVGHGLWFDGARWPRWRRTGASTAATCRRAPWISWTT